VSYTQAEVNAAALRPVCAQRFAALSSSCERGHLQIGRHAYACEEQLNTGKAHAGCFETFVG